MQAHGYHARTLEKNIATYLADTQDEALILQIENLLKPTSDIWDELTDAH